MGAQRLQKGHDYDKKLIRFIPEMRVLIEERAAASHLSFNAALMEFMRANTSPDELKALERKVRQERRRATPTA